MATAIQRRRGSTAQHANFTGLAGEITIDTTLNTIIVHDGVTEGGIRLAKYSEVVSASEGDITAVNTIAGGGLTGGTVSGAANIAIDYENLQGNLVPSVDNVYSLGTADKVWKDVFVGPGSLYVNGQKVLEDNSGTIVVGADEGQNLALNTRGGGDIEFNAIGGGTITLKSNVVVSSGISFSSAGGNTVGFNSNINMTNNQINNVGSPIASSDAATKGYVDTDTTVVRVTGDQSIAGNKSFTGDVSVGGSLTVTGTVTTVNSETIELADNLIDLNSNFTSGNPTENAGLRIKRGDEAAVQLRWNEADDAWEFTNDGATYKAMASAQDARDALSVSGDLGYDSATGVFSFTERTDAEVRGLVSASGDLSYNSTTGVFSFTERTDAQVRNLVNASGDLSYDSNTGIFSYTTPTTIASLSNHNTDDLQELPGATNKYFTEERARASISAGGDLSYNSETGVISFTERTNAEVLGLFSASGDLSYNSETGVISFTERTDAQVKSMFSVSGDLEYNSTTGQFSFTERTDAQVRGLISAGGDLSYDGTTGVISYTGRTDAEVRDLLSGGTGIDFNSTTGAISVDSTIATKTYADNAATTAVAAVIDGSPAALDTLNELAAALGDDANFSATVSAQLGNKYDSADFNDDFDDRLGNKTTDDIAEGTNQYFTNARARGAVSASGDLTYNSTTGEFGFVQRTDAEVRGLISAGGDLSYNSSTGVISYTGRTDAEVRNLFSVTGALNYNPANGQFSVTLPSSDNYNHWKISDGVTSENIVSGSTLNVVGSGATETTYNPTTNTLTITSTDTNTNSVDYVNSASFNTSTGVLTLSGVGNAGATVDLDGRYQSAGNYVTTTSGQALHPTNALEISNDTITLNKADGSSESHSIADANNYVDEVSFDTGNGVLTLGRAGLADLTVDLDGRFTDNAFADTMNQHVRTTDNVTFGVITGTATQARYADLAEKYATDAELEAGTVVCFGGEAEVTACAADACHRVAGVISTDPAYMMNSEAEGQYVALTGRVPCKVVGPVAKGDLMVTSGVEGHAKADNNAQAGRILGKAISAHEGEGEGVVEVLITLM